MAVYLYHVQVFYVMDNYLDMGILDKNMQLLTLVVRGIINTASVIIVATVITLYIEEPMRNLMKK